MAADRATAARLVVTALRHSDGIALNQSCMAHFAMPILPNQQTGVDKTLGSSSMLRPALGVQSRHLVDRV